MAGGWARDGAVNEQIDASIQDELQRMKAKATPVGESLRSCAECEEEIPEARRVALPGVKLCIECMQERDAEQRQRGGINRRGVERQSVEVMQWALGRPSGRPRSCCSAWP